MVVLSKAISLTLLAVSVTVPITSAATLVQNPPSSTNLGGAHILLDNDLDTKTTKYPVILLSKPRSYKDSQTTCASLGEDLVQSSGYGNLTYLMNNSPVAQAETTGIRRLWVANKGNDRSHCTAMNRADGSTVQLSCSTKLPALCKNSISRTTKLPALCKNSISRTVVGVNSDKSKQVTVNTSRVGTYQGYRDQNAFRFLGIPYAQAPVGSLRFVAPKRWTLANNKNKSDNSSVMDATEHGHVCTQFNPLGNSSDSSEAPYFGATQSEDCLYLNVFTPTLKANRVKGLPVMVFIHGGSFTTGAGSVALYEPGNLVSRGGVVVVTLNYRLAIFGLFENTPAISRSKASGNLASRDQLAALLWVRENIAAFGGNPSQVTIFGESAGGWSMRALLSAPSAFGLYRNVISMSDPMGLPFSSPQIASSAIGAGFMRALGCTNSDIACAQNKTVTELQKAQTEAVNRALDNNSWILGAALFRPNADGIFIPGDFADLVRSGRHNKKANILFGWTKDEWGIFTEAYYPNPVPLKNTTLGPDLLMRETNRSRKLFENSPYYKFNSSQEDTVRDVWSKAGTDMYFGCPVQMMSRSTVTSNGSGGGSGKVYTYRMDHGRGADNLVGTPIKFCEGRVCHADDLIPTFGSGDVFKDSEQTGDDARFSRQVIDRFTTFAKTGNPNPVKGTAGPASTNRDLSVQWPVFDTAHSPVFHFDVQNSSVIRNADEVARCNWIAENVQYDYQVHGPSGKVLPIYPPIA